MDYKKMITQLQEIINRNKQEKKLQVVKFPFLLIETKDQNSKATLS